MSLRDDEVDRDGNPIGEEATVRAHEAEERGEGSSEPLKGEKL